jgi:hypothetical protein
MDLKITIGPIIGNGISIQAVNFVFDRIESYDISDVMDSVGSLIKEMPDCLCEVADKMSDKEGDVEIPQLIAVAESKKLPSGISLTPVQEKVILREVRSIQA